MTLTRKEFESLRQKYKDCFTDEQLIRAIDFLRDLADAECIATTKEYPDALKDIRRCMDASHILCDFSYSIEMERFGE